MSDQQQKTTDPARTMERRDQPGWFALSVTLHLAAAALLVFLTPIRDVLWEQAAVGGASSEPQISTRALREVAERLDAVTEDHIERNVEAMRELLDQMDHSLQGSSSGADPFRRRFALVHFEQGLYPECFTDA